MQLKSDLSPFMNVLKSAHTGARGGGKYIYGYKQSESQKNSIIFEYLKYAYIGFITNICKDFITTALINFLSR